MTEPLLVILASPAHSRAHAAFTLAAAAAASGRPVTVFAMGAGCRALLAGLDHGAEDTAVTARGVAGVHELRDACVELGVTLLACDAGLRAEALDQADLTPGAAVAGATTALAAARGGQIVAL